MSPLGRGQGLFCPPPMGSTRAAELKYIRPRFHWRSVRPPRGGPLGAEPQEREERLLSSLVPKRARLWLSRDERVPPAEVTTLRAECWPGSRWLVPSARERRPRQVSDNGRVGGLPIRPFTARRADSGDTPPEISRVLQPERLMGGVCSSVTTPVLSRSRATTA
jgi:hypothetical protein